MRFLACFCGAIVLTIPLAWSAPEPTNSESTPQAASTRLPLAEVQRFTSALSQIRSYYVEPVSEKKLFEDAVRGMLAGLDPHSAYLDEEEFKDLKMNTTGEYGGLGLEITMENGFLK